MDWISKNGDILKSMRLPVDGKAMENLSRKYPWFISARIILDADNDKSDKFLASYYFNNPVPITKLKTIAVKPDLAITASALETNKDTGDIIEKFLERGEHRIVPSEDITDFDAAGQSSILEIEDDMATKELADIYMNQGLTEKAEKIYRMLGQK